MDKLREGYVYDLDKLIRIEGFQGFILEGCGDNHYDMRESESPYDLGKQRILRIETKGCIGETYLILVSELEVSPKIQFIKLNPAGCKISDLLRKKGFKCSIIAEYGGRTGRDGKRHGYYWETWKMALHKRRGIFSEYGYALQYRGWLDYWFHQFELVVLKRGWTMIDGHDIAKFSLWNVTEDIMDDAYDLIKRTLTERVTISGIEFTNSIKDAGLGEYIEYLAMYERDDE